MTIRVLVVDDSATVRYPLRKQLEEAGIETEEARDGAEALEKLQPGHAFDVVVSDLRMPGVDGLTLVNTLQNSDKTAMLPVLILTSSEAREDQIQNLEAGASAYLQKPWDPDVLLAHVRRLAAQKRSHAKLQRASRTDPMTGLANRRHGTNRIDEEITRARRYGRGMTVALLDVDHFKNVNDTFGHATGDEVLKAVAERLRSISRETDVVIRWGGEEFLFVFPETNLEAGAAIVERFRAHMEAAPVEVEGSEPLPVTVSGGVAELEDDDSPDSLVDRADRALYAAKESGRNRLLMWQMGELCPVASS